MSTSGFVGLHYNGELKGCYNHSDSYPLGLGLRILHWVRRSRHKTVKVPALILNLVVVQEGDEPTRDQIEHLARWTNLDVSDQSTSDWYCLLRRTQGDLDAILDCGYVLDAVDSMEEGWAEWGYVVDWDRRVLEVYEGFQTDPHAEGRFAHHAPGEHMYPARLVATYLFDDLPSEERFLRDTG